MSKQDAATIGKLRIKHSMLVACMAASHGCTTDYRYFRETAKQCRASVRSIVRRIRAA